MRRPEWSAPWRPSGIVTASATTRTTAEARGWGALKASDGSFNYEIPAGVDIDAVGSVVIWCRAMARSMTGPLAASDVEIAGEPIPSDAHGHPAIDVRHRHDDTSA